MPTPPAQSPLDAPIGTFDVVRVSGILPRRITKVLTETAGVTRWGTRHFGSFAVVRKGDTIRLQYRRWPIVDTLQPTCDGVWAGEGAVFGIRFCRFRLHAKTQTPA